MRGKSYPYNLIGNYGNFHPGVTVAEKKFIAFLFSTNGVPRYFFTIGFNPVAGLLTW